MSSEYDLVRKLAQPSYEEMYDLLQNEIGWKIITEDMRFEMSQILRKHHWHWFDFWDIYRHNQTGLLYLI